MRRRMAIIGLGRVGRACGEAIAATSDFRVAGIVRQPQSLGEPLPAALRGVPVAPHPSELGGFDAALICLPAALVRETAVNFLQHRIPIVEAVVLPPATYPAHMEAIGRVALRHKVAAVIGAGWNPGALSVFRGLFAALCPQGHIEAGTGPV